MMRWLHAMFVVAVFLVATATAQDCQDYRQTFQVRDQLPLGADAAAMAADGHIILVGTANLLTVYDATNPESIVAVDVLDLGAPISLLASADGMAAAAAGGNLYQLDLDQPQAVTVVSTQPLPAGCENLDRYGSWLFVSRGAAGVDIMDVQADGLVWQSTVDTPGQARQAALCNGRLVIADQVALRCYDLSDPATPVLLDTYVPPVVQDDDQHMNAISASGEKFAARVVWPWEYGSLAWMLQIMTVADDGSLVDPVYDWYGMGPFQLVGEVLHCASDNRYSMAHVDEYPSKLIETSLVVDAPTPLAVGGGVALCLAGGDHAQVMDFRYPSYVAPLEPWDGMEYHGLTHGDLTGHVLKKTDTWSCGYGVCYRWYFYDVSDPDNPLELGSVTGDSEVDVDPRADVVDTAVGRYLAVVNDGDAWPVRVSDWRGGSEQIIDLEPGWPCFAGDRIYSATYTTGDRLVCYDNSTPGVVTELGARPGLSSEYPFGLSETVVLAQVGHLQIVDFSDPAAPVDRGQLAGVEGPVVGRHGDLVFLADTQSLVAVDVSDLDAPSEAWRIPECGVARQLEVHDNVMLLLVDGGMRAFDISEPDAQPQPLGPWFAGEGEPRGFAWVEGVLYTSQMLVYDVSDLGSPTYLGRGQTVNSTVCILDGQLATPDGIYPLQCTSVAVPTDPPAAFSQALHAAPNPFNPQTSLRFELRASVEVSLRIFDLRGRQVAELQNGMLPTGPHVVTWDGRDDAGRDQSSGIYLARLEAGSNLAATKLVLVR